MSKWNLIRRNCMSFLHSHSCSVPLLFRALLVYGRTEVWYKATTYLWRKVTIYPADNSDTENGKSIMPCGQYNHPWKPGWMVALWVLIHSFPYSTNSKCLCVKRERTVKASLLGKLVLWVEWDIALLQSSMRGHICIEKSQEHSGARIPLEMTKHLPGEECHHTLWPTAADSLMLEGHGLVVDLTVLDYQFDLMISAVFSNLGDSMILYMLVHKHSVPSPENVPACTVYISWAGKS